MKKEELKQLQLTRETLHQLDPQRLAMAVGGCECPLTETCIQTNDGDCSGCAGCDTLNKDP